MGDNRRIRLGMVGGGIGAFFGEVHRMAARLDNRFELVAGAFSSDPKRSRESGEQLGLDSARCYDDFANMVSQESQRQDCIEVVAVVTPNHLHFAPAQAFLEAGIHVICDKPLTTSLKEARQLQTLVIESGLLFAVTYTYCGYPMVREAREMIGRGDLGAIRVVQVEYPQQWLSSAIETTGQKQAAWRTDPTCAGVGGSLGDIGTHAFHLCEFVTGLKVERILADLKAFVVGRQLDDNAYVLLHFNNGARGALWASQVAVGHDNGLRLRIYGERASLEWFQEAPDQLQYTPLNQSRRTFTRGSDAVGDSTAQLTRLPAGHPEGLLEAFANLYREVADQLVMQNREEIASTPLLPTVDAGVRGVHFVETAVASAGKGGIWLSLE
ncbi:MAG: Gfo/Idh/MocA family oxidoreductase [Gammaproteobacteria bacterium]|nr:Gfo/Idh/MocA family oxidoreductase [Gammaproteobacteria bacterium]